MRSREDACAPPFRRGCWTEGRGLHNEHGLQGARTPAGSASAGRHFINSRDFTHSFEMLDTKCFDVVQILINKLYNFKCNLLYVNFTTFEHIMNE